MDKQTDRVARINANYYDYCIEMILKAEQKNLSKPPEYPDPPEMVQGKALGFRTWEIDVRPRDNQLILAPMFKNKLYWKPGLNKAVCSSLFIDGNEKGPCGRIGHSCGFNAWNKPESALKYGGYLVIHGAVSGWGDMQIHEEGWRSEKAEIVALFTEKKKLPSKAYSLKRGPLVNFSTYKLENRISKIQSIVYSRRRALKELSKFYGVPVFTSKKKFDRYVEQVKSEQNLITPEF